MRRPFLFLVLSAGVALAAWAGDATGQGPLPPADSWPRTVTTAGLTVTVYQPQVEKWDGYRLAARAAVAVQAPDAPRPTYGVVWLTARTAVDKEHRLVTLQAVEVTRADFPSAPDRAEEYREAVRKAVPQDGWTIDLDRLEASLAVTRAEAKRPRRPLKNDPPRVLFSKSPAVLVLIDGKPAPRPVEGTNLQRVINTRALLLFDEAAGKYYLHLLDRWLEAGALDGPWAVAEDPPAVLQAVLAKFADDPQVDPLDDLADDLKEALENGTVPVVYVSTVPAELIETTGEPDLAPVEGTRLLWVRNTPRQVLLNTVDQNYYVLLSGRWFRAPSLDEGPWAFVPADRLPAEFADIPEEHPIGDVLASVVGTPQAEEAVIADQIPQTATILRDAAGLDPVYDGAPLFEPIGGTDLSYAVNTPTPVVQVGPDSYYACENGVWFTAAAPLGPWAVAVAIPDVIYTIPPSSPIYYATFVYVYGSTPDAVDVGYTPGYLGTCLAPADVVVYGTGWNFNGWVGRYWFGRPWTYGWGARFGWTPHGWGFGFASGWGRPWWSPVAWHARRDGGRWRPGWERGWGGPYAGSHINHINFNNFNVYHRWGDRAFVHAPPKPAVAPPRPPTPVRPRPELNNVLAGRDGHVYRRDGAGWAVHGPEGWHRVEPGRLPPERRAPFADTARLLNREWAARQDGQARANAFRAAAGHPAAHPAPAGPRPGVVGPAGFHGGPAGFRAPVGFRAPAGFRGPAGVHPGAGGHHGHR